MPKEKQTFSFKLKIIVAEYKIRFTVDPSILFNQLCESKVNREKKYTVT